MAPLLSATLINKPFTLEIIGIFKTNLNTRATSTHFCLNFCEDNGILNYFINILKRKQQRVDIFTFPLKGLCSNSGTTRHVSNWLDAAADEEEPKVRNTQWLGHSLRETSRSRRCRRDAAFGHKWSPPQTSSYSPSYLHRQMDPWEDCKRLMYADESHAAAIKWNAGQHIV